LKTFFFLEFFFLELRVKNRVMTQTYKQIIIHMHKGFSLTFIHRFHINMPKWGIIWVICWKLGFMIFFQTWYYWSNNQSYKFKKLTQLNIIIIFLLILFFSFIIQYLFFFLKKWVLWFSLFLFLLGCLDLMTLTLGLAI
jgi:hypothetical protein